MQGAKQLAAIAAVIFAFYAANPAGNNTTDAGLEDHGGHDVVLKDLSNGDHYLKVTVAADGKSTWSHLSVATEDRPGPTPQPDPQPQPNPQPNPQPSPVLTDRAKAIKAVAEKVVGDPGRQDTAKMLAVLYREVAKAARDPAVKNEASVNTALVRGTDMLLSMRGAMVPWQPVRDELAKHWTAVKISQVQRGVFVSSEYAALLEEAANGVDASAPELRQGILVKDVLGKQVTVGISPELWAFILEILKIILPLLIK